MNLERVQQIIASYGADPARWPVAERASAEVLATSDPTLASALAEARSLDAALSAEALSADFALSLSADAAARLTRAALAQTDSARRRSDHSSPSRLSLRRGAPLTRPLLAAAATLLLGFSLGFSGLLPSPSADDEDAVTLAAGMAALTTTSTADTWFTTTAVATDTDR